MSGLCAHLEQARHDLLRARPGYRLAHDREHAWRLAGEWCIREEMERRLAVYAARRRRLAIVPPERRG